MIASIRIQLFPVKSREVKIFDFPVLPSYIAGDALKRLKVKGLKVVHQK